MISVKQLKELLYTVPEALENKPIVIEIVPNEQYCNFTLELIKMDTNKGIVFAIPQGEDVT